jgi:hypothetical protein
MADDETRIVIVHREGATDDHRAREIARLVKHVGHS